MRSATPITFWPQNPTLLNYQLVLSDDGRGCQRRIEFEAAGAEAALFLAQRQTNVPGSAVLAGLEGTRPVLVEVQALVAPSPLGTPRRAVIGWDSNRLAMVLAVLEARCGLQFSGSDIFLNIAGGIRINEPAADLAVAAVRAVTDLLASVGIPRTLRDLGLPDDERARWYVDRARTAFERIGESAFTP